MTPASTPQREPRFDLLKAIAITFVVVCDHSLNVPVGGATVHVAAVLLFVGALLLTAASVFALSRTPLRRFVA